MGHDIDVNVSLRMYVKALCLPCLPEMILQGLRKAQHNTQDAVLTLDNFATAASCHMVPFMQPLTPLLTASKASVHEPPKHTHKMQLEKSCYVCIRR